MSAVAFAAAAAAAAAAAVAVTVAVTAMKTVEAETAVIASRGAALEQHRLGCWYCCCYCRWTPSPVVVLLDGRSSLSSLYYRCGV